VSGEWLAFVVMNCFIRSFVRKARREEIEDAVMGTEVREGASSRQ
jgi:hypothetical protein